jgi:large subunit ribosomal protein L16
MIHPKRTKYLKSQKGIMPQGLSLRANQISFGSFGLKSLEPGKIKEKQIEAARKVIMRKVKGFGKLWIRVFADTPVSSKPVEVRMGKGKGANEYWMAKIKAGRILFELGGVTLLQATQAFNLAAAKLPVTTKIISGE